MSLLIEAIRQWVEESGGSLDDKVHRVRRAFNKWFNDGMSWERWGWVLDVFEDHIMVQYGEKTYRVDYTEDADGVYFVDTPWPVYVLRYVPAEDAAADTTVVTTGEGEGDMAESVREAVSLTVQLAEAAKDDDGLFPGSVIVVEGLSANNNEYTTTALESGVTIFEGAKLRKDHETKLEESDQPEGSIDAIIGKVTNLRMGESNGTPALIGDVYISESETKIRTKVKEGILGDLSIKAWGAGTRADDGHFVVESFHPHPYTNIAMVTVGAAGGKLVSESAHAPDPDADPDDEAQPVQEAPRREVRSLRESDDATPRELTEVLAERDELLTENTRLFRDLRTMQADAQIAEVVSEAGRLPRPTLKRIAERVAALKETFITHGSDQTIDLFRETVEGVVESERAYLAQVTPNGNVVGLTLPGEGDANVDAILAEAFDGLVPANAVKIAVRGRG